MISKTIIENLLIIAAESFWILSCFTQLLRLVKTRDRKGLSAPTQTLNAAGSVAWIAYFTSRQLIVPASTNLINFTITVMTLAYTLSDRKQFARGLLAIATIGPLTSYLLITYPSQSGWVGVVCNVIASTPQLVHVIRTKKTSGISESSLFFAVAALLATFVYGLLVHSIPLMAGCVFGMSSTIIIIAYYYRYRHNH